MSARQVLLDMLGQRGLWPDQADKLVDTFAREVATALSGEEPEKTPAVKKISVAFTGEELYALSDFFGEEGVMDDALYDRIGRKLLVSAAKAGLYDKETE